MTITSFIRHIQKLAFLVFFLGALSSAWASEDYEVVINPRIVDKTLSVNMLRAIFGMRLQTWTDGTKIRVFVLPADTPLHQKFSKGILKIFPYQLQAAWDRLVFSGIGQAPIKVTSTEEMLAMVAKTPGAIGYLWKTDVYDSVDVLQIQRY